MRPSLAMASASASASRGRSRRFDHVGHAHRVARLVGLQAADDVQAQGGVGGAQGGELGGGFLHAVLAEHELAGGEGGGDRLGGMGFGNRDQGDILRVGGRPARGGGGDAVAHAGEIGGDVGRGGFGHGRKACRLGARGQVATAAARHGRGAAGAVAVHRCAAPARPAGGGRRACRGAWAGWCCAMTARPDGRRWGGRWRGCAGRAGWRCRWPGTGGWRRRCGRGCICAAAGGRPARRASCAP